MGTYNLRFYFVYVMFTIPLVKMAPLWKPASITFYGNKVYNNDPYPLSDGSCSCKKAKMYGICYNNWCFDTINDPRMVAAINTPGTENTKICGRCVEMKCSSGRYRGKAGSEFGAPNVCYDMKKSIILQITDSCPEGHRNPNNKKYCSMKHTHFDISFWAFGLIAPHKYGVIDIDYKFVECPKRPRQVLGVVNNTCCGYGRECLYE